MCGFEHNSIDVFDAMFGAPTVTNTDPRTGTYSFFAAGHAAQARWGRVLISPLRAEIFIRVYALSSGGSPHALALWFRLRSSDITALFTITETGDVWLGDAATGVLKGNIGNMDTVYHRYELRLLVDNAAGLFDLRVDGISVVSAFGIDTTSGSGVNDVFMFTIGNIDGAVANDSKWVDDIAINNTLGVVSNSWPGPGAILARDPDADGAVLQYTPLGGGSHFDKVNAANDATYVHDDTPGNIDLWEKPAMASYGNQIVAIGWWLRAQRAAGAAGIIAEYRQLGTNWNLGSIIALTAAWDYYGYFTSENPIFLGMLTRALLDSAEFGVKSIS